MTDYTPLLASLRELQGQIKLDARHCYWKDKARVPGVTSIIRVLDAPKLDEWKVRVQVEGTARAAHANPPVFGEDVELYVSRLVEIAKEQFEHERIADKAADLGTQVHKLIEHAVKEQLGEQTEAPEVSDEALFIFAGWREWAESVGLKPLMAEGKVSWPRGAAARFCGSFDILTTFERGEYAGRIAVLDAKPNARLYDERRLQLAAYAAAVSEHGAECVQGFVVSMPRDGGEIKMVPANLTAGDFQAFLNCLDLYEWRRSLEREARKQAAA